MTTPPPIPGAPLPPEIPAEKPLKAPAPASTAAMPRTYMVWNILAALFMCIVPGIVGIIMSSKVSARYKAGDIEGARRASSSASIWLLITFVCGLINWPFVMLYSALT